MGMTACRIANYLGMVVLLGTVAVGKLGAQADGSVRWGGGYKVGQHVYSSPAVANDGTVYVGGSDDTTPTGGRMLAINRAGTLLWQFPSKPTDPFLNAVESSPAIGADGTVYFGCDDGKLYALDGKTGALKWSFVSGAAEIFSSPTISADGSIYIVSSDLVLHALTSDGVSKGWTHPAGAVETLDTAVAIGSDGTLYIGAPDQNVYALNPDGSKKWQTDAGAALVSSPAIGPDGTIYLGTTGNTVLALAPADGTVKWRYLAGDLVLFEPSFAADGTIYFGSLDGNFYAVNPDSSLKWKVNIGSPIVSTAAVRADGTIIFGANDYLVHALNPDGKSKWTFATQGPVQTSPVIAADGSTYVGSDDGQLYSLNGTIAPLSTFSSWPMLNHDAAHSGRAQATTAGGYLVNLSTYAQAGGSANLIAGFVVQGSASKRFLIRAVGPTLAEQFYIPNVLADPAISLVSAGIEVAANDNWGSDDNFLPVSTATNGVTFQLGSGDKDAALTASLAPGNYSAVVKSTDGGTGVALVEVYDLEVNSPSARLVNLSTRAQSGSGANVLTAGLVIGPIGGQGTLRVLVRAIGPGLAQFGVSGVLAQPMLQVYSGQTVIQKNTGWTSGGLTEDLAAAARLTGAFTLSPSGAGQADCAAVVTLVPGNYTIQVSGAGGTTGEALVEVYVVP
jgi:outer membrane protein assembly factor BamB